MKCWTKDKIKEELNSVRFKKFLRERINEHIPENSFLRKERSYFKKLEPWDFTIVGKDIKLLKYSDDMEEYLVEEPKEKIRKTSIGYFQENTKFKDKCDFKTGDDVTSFKIDGIIAGGAVANIINEYFYEIEAVINDIDIFYYNNLGRINPAVFDEYGLFCGNSEESLMWGFIESKRKGLLNFIRIVTAIDKYPYGGKNTIYFQWREVLKDFDLNCVKVGYHFLSDTIIYEESFLDFLESREIKLELPERQNNQFLSSIFRADQKSKEMGASYYQDKYCKNFFLEICSSDEILDGEGIPVSFNLSEGFSSHDPLDKLLLKEKYKRRLESNKVLVFFNYENGNLYLKSEINYPFFDLLCELNNSNIDINLEDLLKGTDEDILSIKRGKVRLASLILKEYRESISIFNKTLKFVASNGLKKLLFSALRQVLSGTLNLKGLKKGEIKYFFDFISSHYLIESFIYELRQSDFRNLIDLILEFKNKEKIYVGVFESMLGQSRIHLEFLVKNGNIKEVHSKIEKSVLKLKEKLKRESKSVKKEHYIGPFKKYIRELTSLLDLKEEGEYMNHCVGGYYEKIKKHSSIFHIKTTKGETTLEVSDKSGKYKIVQQQGKKTRNFPDQHAKIAKLLVRYLNNYCS
tara:strand:+ start:7308 stop:9209 length:1902 start_codon:yes stop_codon:yes gene_type:complete